MTTKVYDWANVDTKAFAKSRKNVVLSAIDAFISGLILAAFLMIAQGFLIVVS